MSVSVLDRPDVRAVLEQALGRRSLADFCALLDPAYEPAPHTERLCAELELVEAGDVRRLMVFLPPRHSKTYHVSERFPAWYLGRHPGAQVILASYGAELAEANSRKVRALLGHPRYPFAVRVASDSSAVNRWATDHHGLVLAAGVGTAATGFGAHLLVIDDPVKGREEADSETYRQRAWEWYTEVARTRLMPGGAIVLCTTRWHADDLAGRILGGAGDAWRILNLPARAEADDPLGRAEDAPLWPAWYGETALDDLRADLGARAWHALYQQRPSAEEGGLFRRAWFTRRYDAAPKMLATVQAIDSAFKTGVAHDYSVIATWGTDGVDSYLLDLWRERVEFPELLAAISAQYARHRPSAVLLEDTAAGIVAGQVIRRGSPMPLIPVKVTASKQARAAAVSPLCEAGKVVLPRAAGWVEDWIEEHVAFPTGTHDDMVDTTAMALARLAGTTYELDLSTPLNLHRDLGSGPRKTALPAWARELVDAGWGRDGDD